MNEPTKKMLIQCGIFTGIICAFFLFLSLFIVLSRKNWENGLKQAVYNVLPAQEYAVGKIIVLDEKNDQAACFEITHESKSSNTEGLVLVMRTTTYYGPLPAVFICENNSVRFAGIAYLNSSVSREFNEAKFDRQLAFWNDKAEQLFEKAKKIKEGV